MFGIELRPLTLDATEAVLAVIEAAHRHDAYPQVATLEMLTEELSEPDFIAADDGRVAYLDGRLVGWIRVVHHPSQDRLERAYLVGSVHPGARSHGVGTALLAWGRDRAAARLAARPNDLAKFIRVDAADTVADAHRLYCKAGFTPVRWFEDLERPVADFRRATAPAGAQIVPWPVARAIEILSVRNRSFADHWGSNDFSPSQWGHLLAAHTTRTDLSFVAVDKTCGEVIGFALNAYFPADERLHVGRRSGWIEQVGTLPDWRARGVASSLIEASVNAFADAGLTHASLNVDSDNPSGAAGLYRRLGFEPVCRSTLYQIDVSQPPAERGAQVDATAIASTSMRYSGLASPATIR